MERGRHYQKAEFSFLWFKINFRNDGKVRIKCSVEIKGKEVKGGGIGNSIEQADILCLIFLHAVERDLQAVNQNRI